jgi:hypothetical protein
MLNVHMTYHHHHIGMEGGLLQSFVTKESSLTLQVHRRTGSTNVRADSTEQYQDGHLKPLP